MTEEQKPQIPNVSHIAIGFLETANVAVFRVDSPPGSAPVRIHCAHGAWDGSFDPERKELIIFAPHGDEKIGGMELVRRWFRGSEPVRILDAIDEAQRLARKVHAYRQANP